ncbi:MAG: hypothetical protein JSU83_00885 [Deltaproteobacteria bacterium]|nr:MAG: hypothetical protein JSU83_00885 [Deltaproteobacteria bacterium]
MNPILFVVSILWIAAGSALIIYTQGTRACWSRMLDRDNYKWVAVIPLGFGFILVASVFYYPEMLWLALILGILALLKGAYLILGPSRQVKNFFDWWIKKPGDGTLRLYGLFTFILGSALLAYIL